MGVGGQRHAPPALPPGKRPGTHCVVGWMSPRTGLDGWGKSRPPPGFDPRTAQLVAIRYTDWTIPAHLEETSQTIKCDTRRPQNQWVDYT
jgi:hypothetical protein